MTIEADDRQNEEPSSDHYDLNSDAFADALKMSNVLIANPLRTGKPGEVDLFLGMFYGRLKRSPDSIALAKIARGYRLTPPQVSLVILVLTNVWLGRYMSLNEVLVSAVGFNPPETQRLYDWAVRSPLFELSWDGSGLRLSRQAMSAMIGGSSMTDHDKERLRQTLAKLPVALRTDIPDNQQRRNRDET